MPVIVVGADTEAGAAILDRLHSPGREVRAFVSDEAEAARLREMGYKVAVGDVSDSSHVEGASTRCFSAVLIAQAADDGRERSFADDPDQVMRGWAAAVANSKVRRVIWVSKPPVPETGAPEVAVVDPADPRLADRVYELDDAETL
jgi:nucleoside-diphosphate-sugar epimerase